MIAWWVAAAQASTCPTPVSPAAFEAELAAAERGFGALDAARFADELDAATLDLPCLDRVIDPEDAARFHALVGLRLWVAGDPDGAGAAFTAARDAHPGFALEPAVVPVGHEVRELFVHTLPSRWTPFPPPDGVVLWFDGAARDARPEGRPTVVQVVAPGGVVSTTWLAAGDPLPPYPAQEVVPALPSVAPEPVVPAPVVPAPVVPTPVPAPRRKRRWEALVVSGLAASASGVLYGLAASSAHEFMGPLGDDVGHDELLAMRSRTNGLVLGSVGAGAVAVGGVAVFVVLR